MNWLVFMREEGKLRKCGTFPVEVDEEGKRKLPKNIVKDLDVLAVCAAEDDDPLDEGGMLKKGQVVWVNPHRSENPFTYTV